jgi:Lipid A 3-O-deacylase (PagL)
MVSRLKRLQHRKVSTSQILKAPERFLSQRRLHLRFAALTFLLAAAATISLAAQTGPEQGGHEIQIWTGGGHSVAGGRGDTGVFNAGLRYGWVLTAPHLPGILRGRFEYAVDGVPVFFVFQPANTAYGVGFDPFALKWNFERHGRFSPYLELCGGTLFTDHNVPTYTNSLNFTDQAAFGVHVLGPTHNVNLELRYMHISNAGLSTLNPGINTVQVRLGIGKFLRPR